MRLVQDVTNRFIQNDRPTPQPQTYKKLQGRDDILNSLVAHDFLHQFFGDELVPGLLAFEYGDSEILKTVPVRLAESDPIPHFGTRHWPTRPKPGV